MDRTHACERICSLFTIELLELLTTDRGDFVVASNLSFISLVVTFEQLGFLQRMEQWVERAWADMVSMFGEFLD